MPGSEKDLAVTTVPELQKEKDDSQASEVVEFDGFHDGLEFPTEEEKATLRRVSDTVPWNAYRMFELPSHCDFRSYYLSHCFRRGCRTILGMWATLSCLRRKTQTRPFTVLRFNCRLCMFLSFSLTPE